MRARAVKPHEIPRRLLEQKKAWDLEVFYEIAARDPAWWAVLFDEGDPDDPVAAVILADAPLYYSVQYETLIVDKARRTPERVREAFYLGHELAVEKARQLGRKYVGWASPDPGKWLDTIGHPPKAEILEHVTREEI